MTLEEIGNLAEYCLDRGVFWVSTWGPDCERVHDIFNENRGAWVTTPALPFGLPGRPATKESTK